MINREHLDEQQIGFAQAVPDHKRPACSDFLPSRNTSEQKTVTANDDDINDQRQDRDKQHVHTAKEYTNHRSLACSDYLPSRDIWEQKSQQQTLTMQMVNRMPRKQLWTKTCAPAERSKRTDPATETLLEAKPTTKNN